MEVWVEFPRIEGTKWFNELCLEFRDKSLGRIAQVNPEVLKAYGREELCLEVTDDLEGYFDKLVEAGLLVRKEREQLHRAMASKTVTDTPLPAMPFFEYLDPRRSLGSTIYLRAWALWDATKSREYNEMMALAIILHEGHHLLQPNNPPEKKLVFPVSQREAEFKAYSGEITDLKKYLELLRAQPQENRFWIQELEKVIEREQMHLALWRHR